MKARKAKKAKKQNEVKKGNSVTIKKTWAQFADSSKSQKSRNRNFDKEEWTCE